MCWWEPGLPISVPAIKSDHAILIWNPLDPYIESEKHQDLADTDNHMVLCWWMDKQIDAKMDGDSLSNEGGMDETADQ